MSGQDRYCVMHRPDRSVDLRRMRKTGLMRRDDNVWKIEEAAGVQRLDREYIEPGTSDPTLPASAWPVGAVTR